MSPLAKVLSFTLLFSSSCVGVSLSASNTGPVVELSYGSFQGNATGDLVEFLGMPFAAPPYVSTRILLVVILLIDILLFLEKCWKSPICSGGTTSQIHWSPPSY